MMALLDLRSHVKQISGEEDAATETHEQTDYSASTATIAFNPSRHAMWNHSENER